MGCELSCTCAGYVILPKAVEVALNGGRDMLTGKQVGLPCAEHFDDFDAFYREVQRQAAYFCEQSMRRVRAHEPYMAQTGASPLLSGSMQCCMESGKDVYEGGAKYNDSSIVIFGIGTATDALLAVKKLVFEEKRIGLEALTKVLKNNWAGQEKLRLIARTKAPKYGCGNAEADSLAADLMARTTAVVNGQPNARGGVFRSGGFSIDLRFTYGKRCAASADGRFAHESLSKNMSASDGIGANGVTAMMRSACAIDFTDIPDGTALDIVLHSSSVSGEDGLAAVEGLVDAFLNMGGFALQINVLDPAVLKKAQREPEKYRNLQVRLCGWNVRFVDLKEHEQDEFICWSSVG
jgi:formate C-acetyltransferase